MMEIYENPVVYAVKHKSGDVIDKSQSGGAFTALSDVILDRNGVIYSCVLSENLEAIHVRADSKIGRNKMRGSKYVQSSIGDTYKLVQKDLRLGRPVLFSGTSCQVTGLQSYLKTEYDNLFCVDIVCHGVPSPLVWNRYVEWQEKRIQGKIIDVNFRNKGKFGWHSHVETMDFLDGSKIDSEIYKNIFYGHGSLRPCCFKCPYKSIVHRADVTIADCWGIEKVMPEMDDNRGTSLLLVNTDKGAELFEKVKATVAYKNMQLCEELLQQPLVSSFPEPEFRTKFWNDFYRKPFKYIANWYGYANTMSKILRRIERKFKSILNKSV